MKITGTYTPKDRTIEDQWIRQHRAEYASQWVALDGDTLLGHSTSLMDVADAVKASGVTDALYVFIESPDAPPFAGHL